MVLEESESKAPPAPAPTMGGNAVPWAILAFSTTSFMLGLYNAGLVNGAGESLIIPMAMIYGGLVQLIIGVLEVFKGNTFAVVVFGSYGPFWIMFGLIEQFYGPMVVEAGGESALNNALVVFLAMFTVLTIFFVIASFVTDITITVLLSLVVLALVLLMAGTAGGNPGLAHLSGYLTLLFGMIGWYRGFAWFLESFWGREVLPVGHFNRR